MVQSEIQQNQIPNEPELKDLLALHKKSIFLGLNCHAVATVQSFNATNQTANATINYKRTYFQPDVNGVYQPVLKDYPQLVDCPVMFLGGGGAALTFPVAQGDECLVLFNDRDLDNWFAGSSNSPVATPRLHSFSDAIILVGLRSQANAIQGFSTENMQVKTGNLTVTFRKEGGLIVENSIGDFTFEDNADVTFDTGTVEGLFGNGGHVKFQNGTGELIKAIQDLATAIQSGTAGGDPFVLPPAFTTALSVITSFVEP